MGPCGIETTQVAGGKYLLLAKERRKGKEESGKDNS